MRIGSLTVWPKYCNSKNPRSIAYFHSPHSLTWRWSLSVGTHPRWRPFASRWANPNGSGSVYLGACRLMLHFNWQQPMWYRDLYMRMRDERDQLDGMMWLPDNHPHKVHRPPPPNPLESMTPRGTA